MMIFSTEGDFMQNCVCALVDKIAAAAQVALANVCTYVVLSEERGAQWCIRDRIRSGRDRSSAQTCGMHTRTIPHGVRLICCPCRGSIRV